jgi:prepilin signal peptidase PulO-like enzyme (type II secretory pathway)
MPVIISVLVSVIVGFLIGILINYFSDVLPVSRRISRPLCSACNEPYTLKDYLLFGKCSKCDKKASIRSIIVLIVTIAVCILLQYFPFARLGFWATLPLLLLLGVIVVIDIEHHLVLTQTSIVGFVLLLVYGIIMHGVKMTLLGSLAGFLIMLVFFIFGLVFSKVIGKIRHREIDEVAFGFGDVSAGTIIGLLAGWPVVIGAIIIAILAFGAYSLIYILILLITKKYSAFTSAVPFAPFLILGLIVIFYL